MLTDKCFSENRRTVQADKASESSLAPEQVFPKPKLFFASAE